MRGPRRLAWPMRAEERGQETVDIRQLKTLIAIADHGTFRGAADAVGLTQSAVSQHIRAVEDDLQLRLFDRSQRPPKLTVQGQTLVEAARKLVDEYERIVSNLSEGRLVGALHLGAIRTAPFSALPEALVVLRERFPELRIHVLTGDTTELPGMVMTGRIDAAIVPGEANLPREYRWMPFAVEPMWVIAPIHAEGATDRELLEGYPFIRFNRPVPSAYAIEQEIRRREIQVSEVMAIDSFAGIVEMVTHGLGVSVVPQQSYYRPFPPGIRHVAFGEPPISRTVGIIDKRGGGKSLLVDALHAELWRLSGSPAFADET